MAGELLAINELGMTTPVDNTYEAIKAALNGATIDLVALPDTKSRSCLFVDDEGIFKELGLNVPASIMAGMAIFGVAVLCGPADSEGETLPPDPRVVAAFTNLGAAWGAVVLDADNKGQKVLVQAQPETLPPPQVIALTEEEFLDWLKGTR